MLSTMELFANSSTLLFCHQWSLAAIAASLMLVCASFFSIHAAVITAYGYAYSSYGWHGAVGLGTAVLLLPLGLGLMEITQERRSID
jgi:hypothetical protein